MTPRPDRLLDRVPRLPGGAMGSRGPRRVLRRSGSGANDAGLDPAGAKARHRSLCADVRHLQQADGRRSTRLPLQDGRVLPQRKGPCPLHRCARRSCRQQPHHRVFGHQRPSLAGAAGRLRAASRPHLPNSKSRPKVDGIPVPAKEVSHGVCRQIGSFAALKVTSISCSATRPGRTGATSCSSSPTAHRLRCGGSCRARRAHSRPSIHSPLTLASRPTRRVPHYFRSP